MIPVLGSAAPTAGDADSTGAASRGRTDSGGGDFGQILGTQGTARGTQAATSDTAAGGGKGGNLLHTGGKALPDAGAEADTDSAGQSAFGDALLAPSADSSDVAVTAQLAAPGAPAVPATLQAVAGGELSGQIAAQGAQQLAAAGSQAPLNSLANLQTDAQSPALGSATSTPLEPVAGGTGNTQAAGTLAAAAESVELAAQAANPVQSGSVAAEVLRSGAPAATGPALMTPGTQAVTAPTIMSATDTATPNLLPDGARQAEAQADKITQRASVAESLQRTPGGEERLLNAAQTITASATRMDAVTEDTLLTKAVAETFTPNSAADAGRSLTTPTTAAGSALAGVATGLIAPSLETATPGGIRAAASGAISAHPGEPAWNNDVAGRVSLMMRNGNSEASLQLNPPELGRMDIKIATDGDATRVLFTVQGAETRELIEQAMPRLREMLEQSGLSLSRFDVADQSSADRQGAGDFESAVATSDAEPEVASGPAGVQASSANPQALVDYYV